MSAYEHIREAASNIPRDFWLEIYEAGVIIRKKWVGKGGMLLEDCKVVSWNEIESCVINPITAMIDQMQEPRA